MGDPVNRTGGAGFRGAHGREWVSPVETDVVGSASQQQEDGDHA